MGFWWGYVVGFASAVGFAVIVEQVWIWIIIDAIVRWFP